MIPDGFIRDAFLREQPGADALREGYFLLPRRRSNCIDLPVRIWFGVPVDEDGEPLDRSPRWQVMVAGMLIDGPEMIGGMRIDSLADIWPRCGTEPITVGDYAYRIARQQWAAEHDPLDPFGTPGGKIDPMTAPLPFLEDQ